MNDMVSINIVLVSWCELIGQFCASLLVSLCELIGQLMRAYWSVGVSLLVFI